MSTPEHNARRIPPALVATALLALLLGMACVLALPKRASISFDPDGHPRVFGIAFTSPKSHRAVLHTLDVLNFRFKFRLPENLSRDETMKALCVMDQAMGLGSARQDASDWHRIKVAALQRQMSALAKELEESRQDESILLKKLNPPPPLIATLTDEAAYAAAKQRSQQLLLVEARFAMQLDGARLDAQSSLKK